MTPSRLALAAFAVLPLSSAWAEDPAPPGGEPAPRAEAPAPPATAGPAAPATGPRGHASVQAAAAALAAAFAANDDEALRALLGPESADLVQDGKDPAVRRQREELAAAARAGTTFRGRPDGRVTILVGAMQHPLAIPLVARGGNGPWTFDAAAGREELLARRVGENELDAVGLCLAYVQAQRVYGSADRDGDGVLEYAQRIVSTEGARDGLYWEAAEGEEPSPGGPELTPFREGLDPVAAREAPFAGYRWRVLHAQGPQARGGEKSWLQGENLVGGFGLVAVPAEHGNTGVLSFLVGPDGRVLEKDLGPEGAVAAIERYDPDPSWTPVDAPTLRLAAASDPGTPFDSRATSAGGSAAGAVAPAGYAGGNPCRR